MARLRQVVDMEISISELQSAIERAFGAPATLERVEPMAETFDGRPVWEGAVHVFDIVGHLDAKIAYAWAAPIEGNTTRRFYTVLGKPPINSAADAVRAASVAETEANHDQGSLEGRGAQPMAQSVPIMFRRG
jgi:hypothetical protein